MATIQLIKFDEAVFLFKVHMRDFWVFVIVFVVTLFFGIESGLLLGIVINWAYSLKHNVRSQESRHYEVIYVDEGQRWQKINK